MTDEGTQNTAPDQPPAHVTARLERLWQRMAFEVNLINQRFGWFMTGQAFLIAAFIFAMSEGERWNILESVVLYGTSVLGIVISLAVSSLVRAASETTRVCRREYLALKSRHPAWYSDDIDNDAGVARMAGRARRWQDWIVRIVIIFWFTVVAATLADALWLSAPERSKPIPAPPAESVEPETPETALPAPTQSPNDGG